MAASKMTGIYEPAPWRPLQSRALAPLGGRGCPATSRMESRAQAGDQRAGDSTVGIERRVEDRHLEADHPARWRRGPSRSCRARSTTDRRAPDGRRPASARRPRRRSRGATRTPPGRYRRAARQRPARPHRHRAGSRSSRWRRQSVPPGADLPDSKPLDPPPATDENEPARGQLDRRGPPVWTSPRQQWL